MKTYEIGKRRKSGRYSGRCADNTEMTLFGQKCLAGTMHHSESEAFYMAIGCEHFRIEINEPHLIRDMGPFQVIVLLMQNHPSAVDEICRALGEEA